MGCKGYIYSYICKDMADKKESEWEVVNKKAISELVNTWGAAMLCKYCHEDGNISFVLLYDNTEVSTIKSQQSQPILTNTLKIMFL